MKTSRIVSCIFCVPLALALLLFIVIDAANITHQTAVKMDNALVVQAGEDNSTMETNRESDSDGKRKLKILVYSPTLGWSHSQFMGAVADTLAKAGHEVHFLRFLMSERDVSNKDTSKAHKIYQISPTIIKKDATDVQRVTGDLFRGSAQAKFAFTSPMWSDFVSLMLPMCEELVQRAELIDRLEAEHFDVAIAELFDVCPFAFFHRLGIRTQLATSAAHLFQQAGHIFGIPSFSSYMPNMIAPPKNAPLHMSFVERARNLYNDLFEYFYLANYRADERQAILRRAFGNDFPIAETIARNISLFFLNSNPFYELPHPISHKIVNIAGLVKIEGAPLDQAITSILDRSQHGVVLVSFGSVVDTKRMNNQLLSTFLRAFAQFPRFEFIWKFEIASPEQREFIARLAPNVHPIKWLDQKSLLMHPKMRAFITHSGQNSMLEAAHAGVPVLSVPIFGDQLFNALLAQFHGVGVQLDVLELHAASADKLIADALEKILHDPSYQKKAKVLAKKFRLTPFSPRERLVKWVEFAAEFPDLNELNLPDHNELSWFSFYSVDVLLVTFAVLAIIFVGIFVAARTIWRTIQQLNTKIEVFDAVKHTGRRLMLKMMSKTKEN